VPDKSWLLLPCPNPNSPKEQAERSVDKAEAAGLKIFRKIAAKCGIPDLTRR